jgi:hypothetical protein
MLAMEEEAHIALDKTGTMGRFYPHEILSMEVLRLYRGKDVVGSLASSIAARHIGPRLWLSEMMPGSATPPGGRACAGSRSVSPSPVSSKTYTTENAR